jgi:cobalt/nickel transport system ATP-binding protein
MDILMAMEGKTVLKINELSVRYPDENQVLTKINVQIEAGETVGIVGANGAGKSTLFKSIVGIMLPTEGSIEIDGITVTKKNLNTIREKVGVVFQNPEDQLFMSNVYDDIAFGLRNYGMAEEKVKDRIDQVAKSLGIERLLTHNSSKLSGGEMRLIAIATILVMEPSIVLFDEPSSFLDPRTRRKLMEMLRSFQVTKVIATHDLDMALELCDRVIILKEGRVFRQGAAKELLADEILMEEAGLELPYCLQRKE